VDKLEQALSGFLREAPLKQVAIVLTRASDTGSISYEQAEQSTGGDPEDALLIAYEQRMLIPVRSIKGTLEWDDAVLLCQPGEIFRMPNVVRYLTKEASLTGEWAPLKAVGQLLREMGEPEWDSVSELVHRLGERADYRRVTADQIGEACRELGLGDRLDLIIAELKGVGVISPKLGFMAETLVLKSPLYELNPSIVMESYSGGPAKKAKQNMVRANGLAVALSSRFPAAECPELAMVLELARGRGGTIPYQQIDLPGPRKDDLVMQLHEERLLISTTTSASGGSAWRDKLLTFEPGEKYQMPRVVRHLVEEADITKTWNPRLAEEQCLREVMEHDSPELMRFWCAVKASASDCLVTPHIMKETAAALGIELDLHQAIDAMTRCGMISPPITSSFYAGLAQYEINRSLCWTTDGT
jgi:hypothetical protein